jgi:hypothetical protein
MNLLPHNTADPILYLLFNLTLDITLSHSSTFTMIMNCHSPFDRTWGQKLCVVQLHTEHLFNETQSGYISQFFVQLNGYKNVSFKLEHAYRTAADRHFDHPQLGKYIHKQGNHYDKNM